MMRKRSEKGFTLIEVLVSMAIFSFGFLAIIKMQILATTINVQSRGMTEGIIVAQNRIEELSILSYTDGLLEDRTTGANVGGAGAAGLDDFPIKPGATNNADQTDEATNTRYTTYWNIADDTPFTDTKTIRVIVRWADKGVFKSFSIDAVRTREFN
jgi:prepilin-type N-terminal cleavage/methylation domain-containing protein